MPSHSERIRRNYRDERRISMPRAWFEQLEACLHADERCTRTSEVPWPLLLVTPFGKTLAFVPEQTTDAEIEQAIGLEPVHTPEDLRKIELVKGLLERGLAAAAEEHAAAMDKLAQEWMEETLAKGGQ